MHVLLLCPLGAVVLRFFKGDTLPFPVELPHHRYWSTQQGTVHIHLCVPWKRGKVLTPKIGIMTCDIVHELVSIQISQISF